MAHDDGSALKWCYCFCFVHSTVLIGGCSASLVWCQKGATLPVFRAWFVVTEADYHSNSGHFKASVLGNTNCILHWWARAQGAFALCVLQCSSTPNCLCWLLLQFPGCYFWYACALMWCHSPVISIPVPFPQLFYPFLHCQVLVSSSWSHCSPTCALKLVSFLHTMFLRDISPMGATCWTERSRNKPERALHMQGYEQGWHQQGFLADN